MKTIIHTSIIRNWTAGVLFLLLTTPSADALTNLAQQAYVKASNTGYGDYFGQSMAIDGNTMVIGANYEDSNATGVNGNQTNNLITDSGAAYVFVRYGSDWVQQAYLKASNTGTNDWFGWSVAISGDTIVVGALLEGSSATGVNGDGNNDNAASSGAAYVFVRNGANWSQQAYLKASNTGVSDLFGRSVAISGDTIVVGAEGEASNATGVDGNQANNSLPEAGAAYVFVRNGTTWSQQAYLKASNTPGSSDDFGHSVAISGDTVVVGAHREDSNATGVNGDGSNNLGDDSGAAYVFVRNGTTWTQQAYVKASNTGGGDNFGWSVAISSNTVAVGATLEDSDATGVNGIQTNNLALDSGAVYIFVRSGTNWSQQAYFKASNTEANDFFGQAVAVSGDILVVGANGEDSSATGINGNQGNGFGNNIQPGAAYVFTRSGTNWSQQYYLKQSNTTSGGAEFGIAVGVSSNTVVVGAHYESGISTGVNHNQFTSSSYYGSGAAYVFSDPVVLPPNTNFVAVQPALLYLFTGTTGMFTATVTGETPIAYEWQNNSTPIPGATGSTLVFTNAQTSDTLGYYSVVVLFSNGLITSTNEGTLALLSSVDEISLDVDPSYQTVPIGGTASINALVSGPTPLSFQWYKDNTLIPGRTDATLVFNNAQLTNSADYTYTATYTQGTVSNSTTATLVVFFAQPPVITGSRLTAPDTFELRFTGLTNRNYQINYATNLSSPVFWQPYGSVLLETNPVVYPITIPLFGTEDRAYFQVEILPP